MVWFGNSVLKWFGLEQEHGECRNGTCLCREGWNGRLVDLILRMTINVILKDPLFNATNTVNIILKNPLFDATNTVNIILKNPLFDATNKLKGSTVSESIILIQSLYLMPPNNNNGKL